MYGLLYVLQEHGFYVGPSVSLSKRWLSLFDGIALANVRLIPGAFAVKRRLDID